MNVSIWTKRFFDEKSAIDWPCPNCFSSSLELVKDKFSEEETASSKLMRKESDVWEVEWISLVVSGRLNCKSCGETVFFTGKGSPEPYMQYDEEANDHFEHYSTSFTPTYFEPTLKIFQIPSNCPKELKDEIENSFKLFWTDLPSCANKIRVALEILMNEKGIRRFQIKKGKRAYVALHDRIMEYNHPEVKDILLSIKWIGNTGTHTGQLETIDLIEAYRLLEFSLQKIYIDESKELKKISKEINKRKGTRKRKE